MATVGVKGLTDNDIRRKDLIDRQVFSRLWSNWSEVADVTSKCKLFHSCEL